MIFIKISWKQQQQPWQPKKGISVPVVTKLYPSPKRKQVHNKVQRLENSRAKPSFLEIEVHSQKAGWDCVEGILSRKKFKFPPQFRMI
jgi:hypothetical protein